MREANERSEETKKKLMTATRDLICEKGWSSVSHRAIARRAGVNLALINYHFGGQKKLLAATLDAAVAELTATYSPSTAAGGDIREFISAAITVVPKLVEDPNARVLAVAMLEATYDQEIAKAVKQNLTALRAQIAVILAEHGLSSTAASGWVTVLAALLDGIMLHFLLDPDTDIAGAAAAVREMRWERATSLR